MMTVKEKIHAEEQRDEAWDIGELGQDVQYAEVSNEDIELDIDEAAQLQLISIRLQKSLIEDLKEIAILNGIGYQPLMRQILMRFADCTRVIDLDFSVHNNEDREHALTKAKILQKEINDFVLALETLVKEIDNKQ